MTQNTLVCHVILNDPQQNVIEHITRLGLQGWTTVVRRGCSAPHGRARHLRRCARQALVPRDGQLAQHRVEVEVHALADRRAQQRGLQAVEQPAPAGLLQHLLSAHSAQAGRLAARDLRSGRGRTARAATALQDERLKVMRAHASHCGGRDQSQGRSCFKRGTRSARLSDVCQCAGPALVRKRSVRVGVGPLAPRRLEGGDLHRPSDVEDRVILCAAVCDGARARAHELGPHSAQRGPTVIRGYVAISATIPPIAPESPSTAALDAMADVDYAGAATARHSARLCQRGQPRLR
jgi:hypothetical protein